MSYIFGKFGISNLGSTSGTSGMVNRQIVFAGSNVTLSQSINASSATLTISAAAQTVQTQNVHNLTIGSNTAGVGAAISSGTLTLAGGSNITLSQNGDNAITIHGNAGGGGSVNFSAGTTSNNLAAVTFSNSNGVGFGLNGSVITASHNGITSQTNQTIGIYGVGNTTQSSSGVVDARSLSFNGLGGVSVGYSNGSVQISGGAGGGGGGIALANAQTTYATGTANLAVAGGALTIASAANQSFNFSVPQTSSLAATGAVSISTDGSTISIGAPAGATLSYYNPQDGYLQVTGQQGQGTLHMQPSPAPNVVFDRAVFPVVFTGATASTASVSLSMWLGVYTRTVSTLSLLMSFSTSGALTHSGTANSSQNVGVKLFTMGATSSLSEGQYFMGILSRTASAGANATISQMLASQQASNLSGFWGQANNATIQYTRGLGAYTATTGALPSSVALSQLNGTASLVLRQPLFYFVSGTV